MSSSLRPFVILLRDEKRNRSSFAIKYLDIYFVAPERLYCNVTVGFTEPKNWDFSEAVVEEVVTSDKEQSGYLVEKGAKRVG